jgi:hypothetical protein
MSELNRNQNRFTNNWETLCDLVRFSGGENGATKTAKGLKLSANIANDGVATLFVQAYEGQNRITIKPSKGELLEFAFAIIKELLK